MIVKNGLKATSDKPRKVRVSTGDLFKKVKRYVKQTGSQANVSYLKLIFAFPIRPLLNDDDLHRAIKVLDRLLRRKRPLDVQEQGYFDSLTHEIQLYEQEHVAIPDVSGAAMLQNLIEMRDSTLSDVAFQTGIAVSTISAILSGKRKMTLTHIQKLAQHFRVAPGVFLTNIQ